MNRHKKSVFLHLVIFFDVVKGQSQVNGDAVTNFQPSLAVVIGILSIMFSLTFLLLLYAKFCHRRGGGPSFTARHRLQSPEAVARTASGIEKSVVKSLPFFKFSALRGSREGLECAVCLSRFEDVEVLRLLPRCKHAFHVDCVDRWLEKHSSCPLCRHRVSPDDVAVFAGSESLRFLRNDGDDDGDEVDYDRELDLEDSNVELFVRREDDRYGNSSRFSVGSSFRTIEIVEVEKGIENCQQMSIPIQDRRDREDRRLLFGQDQFGPSEVEKGIENCQEMSIPIQERDRDRDREDRRFLFGQEFGRSEVVSKSFRAIEVEKGIENCQEMSIPIQERDQEDRRLLFGQEFGPSEVVFKNRWSNVSSSDLMFLESEMISESSTKRFSELGSSSNPRSVSEIIAISRFGGSCLGQENAREKNTRKLWLPIAKKTVEWFADREKNKKNQLQESENTNQEPKTLLV